MRPALHRRSKPDPRFVLDEYEPVYLETWRRGLLDQKVEAALKELEECKVCPRNCGINRLQDEQRVCHTGRHAIVSSAFPHFGEEDCLRGFQGSGTIFFGLCNLRCVFCQNWDISQREDGREMKPEEIANLALELQALGCHNINCVTPEHVAPQVVEAIAIAIDNAIRTIAAHRPFNEICYRLGIVAHFIADANNPLNAAGDDAEEGRYYADFLAYLESVEPRIQLVFYGFRPELGGRDLAALVTESLERGREYYPLVGREYRRVGFASGAQAFDDRSTAFGVASLAYSHAVSDIAEALRYIWIEAGGIDTRRRIPERGREIVRLPRTAAPSQATTPQATEPQATTPQATSPLATSNR